MKGKSALITGSSDGLGFAMAEGLARAGCNVVLHGLEAPDNVHDSLIRIEQDYGVQATYIQVDLTDPNAVETLLNTARERTGGIDILINNAVVRHFASIEDFPADRWNQALAVNLTAAFLAIQRVLPDMRARGWGRIFNMTSVYGSRATPNRVDYVTTKTALLGLTRAVALETVHQGITCNAICPGTVKTPNIESRIEQLMEERGLDHGSAVKQFLTGKQPTGEFVSASHVAELVVFLCSDAGSQITGAMMPMEGGWLAG
ncbi:3-hydroxybutyrate dehydrogenase [Caballeronia sp. LjRoot29]|uniref:3-hydroxybutyrate dehydrogenase n=1 Tax=Caballeronia sp. LjRoot29 TaxID=3342315 RepID=UPI003ECDE997